MKPALLAVTAAALLSAAVVGVRTHAPPSSDDSVDSDASRAQGPGLFVPVFSRIGSQPHLLVFSAQAEAGTETNRHRLEQLAVNNSWFLYQTGDPEIFSSTLLSQFDLIIINQSIAPRLAPAQQSALDAFVQHHKPLVLLPAPTPLPQLAPRLQAALRFMGSE